jgi:membrane-associated phospholipid phosphatase
VAILLLLILVLYNVRLGICATLSFLSAALVSNSLKYFFFDEVNRPAFIFRYIERDHAINYVEGLDLHIHNSFPSGHATQAFAIFMCLVFASKNTYLKILFFLIAFLTAFSRVYLSQHWLIDITAGSIIGFSFSFFYEYLLIHKNKFEKLNTSVFKLKRAA